MTAEAITVLQRAAQGADGVQTRFYGLAHAREVAEQIAPGLQIQSLDYLYGLEGVARPVVYRDLAEQLVRKAKAGVQIVYLVAGSPLFYNDAVLKIRRLAAKEDLSVRLVHGLSFVEIVLERVHWRGNQGLQLYSAWNVAMDGLELSLNAPALLCQLGEFSSGGDALDDHQSQKMLALLRDKLAISYGMDHLVTVLYSSGPPQYNSLSRRLPIKELAEQTVPVYSNLFVPAVEVEEEGEECFVHVLS